MHRLSDTGFRRLTEQLVQAREAGVDLDPRAPHIRAAAPIYRDKARELRQVAREIHSSSFDEVLVGTPSAQTLLRAVELILSTAEILEQLSAIAADFPLDPPCNTEPKSPDKQ